MCGGDRSISLGHRAGHKRMAEGGSLPEDTQVSLRLAASGSLPPQRLPGPDTQGPCLPSHRHVVTARLP